jgi:hypothetical protein
MAIDNTSLQIEDLKLKTGSYRDAFFEVMMKHNMYDPEDLWEVLHPIVKEHIKQEFIDANMFGSDSPFKKRNDLSAFFDK